MKNVLTFIEYIKENDGGGGVAFATPNGNGMGNVVAPTVGSTPGSVWQSGSGQIGSGDSAATATQMGKKFGQFINKDKKSKKYKKPKKQKPLVYTKMNIS